jgi:AMIN domain
MNRSLRAAAGLLLWAAACFPTPVAGQARALPSIRRVQVLGARNQVEIEIEATDRVVPQTNVLTGPDRLVVDFVNAVPGAQLRSQAVNRGAVKSLRVGLFSSDPPVTRVVLDLNGPQPYQVFPSGRTVIVKVGGSAGAETAASSPASGSVLVNTSYSVQAVPVSEPAPPPAKPPLEVSFQGGLLSITSNKASLSEVLFAIHERTGAEIAIPAGAEQEKVVVDLGPAPAPEVLAHLLNGSKFNFLILSSSTDSGALDRVILSARPDGPMPASRPQPQPVTDQGDDDDAQSRVAPPSRPAPPNANPSPSTDGQAQPAAPETKNPPNNDSPD